MNVFNILVQQQVFIIIIGFIVCYSLLMYLAAMIASSFDSQFEFSVLAELTDWYLENLWLPILRIMGLITFILLVYPTLYGFNYAPNLYEVLIENGRFNSLMGFLFILLVIFSVVPVIKLFDFILVPSQGILAVALLFSWLPYSESAVIKYSPTPLLILAMICYVIVSYWLLRWFITKIQPAIDRIARQPGSAHIVFETVFMTSQLPLLIYYGLSLGRQV